MWHLKDREFEKKLNETSYPMHTFTDALNKKLHGLSSEFVASLTEVEVVFQRISEEVILGCLMNFSSREIEEVPDYNPKDWNDIRKVKPPYNVMMRVDFGIDESIGFKAFYRKFLDGDGWCFADGKTMPESYSDTIARFRPWED